MKKLISSLLLSTVLFSANAAQAKEVEGVNYDNKITVSGKKLSFIGAGIRTKWMFHVYTMGVYSESGACDKDKLVNNEEVKSILLVMLRGVSAQQMSSTIGEAFENQLPENAPAELKEKRNKFESLFKDKLEKGDHLQFDYIPGKGMTISQNGKVMGTIEGSDFSKVFFKIYFSAKPCCPELIKTVMECSK